MSNNERFENCKDLAVKAAKVFNGQTITDVTVALAIQVAFCLENYRNDGADPEDVLATFIDVIREMANMPDPVKTERTENEQV